MLASAVCPNIRIVKTGYSKNNSALNTVPQRTQGPRVSAPLMRHTIFWAKNPWAIKQNNPQIPRYWNGSGSKALTALKTTASSGMESVSADNAGPVGIYCGVGHANVRQVDLTLAVKFPTKIMLRRVSATIQNPGDIRGIQNPHTIQKNKKCRAQQRGQRIPLPVPESSGSSRVGRRGAQVLFFSSTWNYRSKVVDMVVNSSSPCSAGSAGTGLPLQGAVGLTGQALPGLDADKVQRLGGHGPDQHVGIPLQCRS